MTGSVLRARLAQRLLVLDGAMGTLIQGRGLSEGDVRGARFRDHPFALKDDYDVLLLTAPDIVARLHWEYLEAGADVIRTHTFSSTSVVQRAYGLDAHAYELNLVGARLARAAADEWSNRTPDRPRFVAGTIGPTSARLLAGAPPGGADAAAESIRDAYREQIRGLIDGGVDLLLAETVFDSRSARAAVAALEDECAARDRGCPLIVSATASDVEGRTVAGQTVESFHDGVQHTNLLGVGLNCSFGADGIRFPLAALAAMVSTVVSCHPSAGLPNARGGYDTGPETWAAMLHALAADGLLNIVGGCCGTTPAYIRALAGLVRDLPPRPVAGSLPLKAQ